MTEKFALLYDGDHLKDPYMNLWKFAWGERQGLMSSSLAYWSESDHWPPFTPHEAAWTPDFIGLAIDLGKQKLALGLSDQVNTTKSLGDILRAALDAWPATAIGTTLPDPGPVSNKGTITFYKATVWGLSYGDYPIWQRFFAKASTAYGAAEEAKTRLLEELGLDDEELSTEVSQVQTVD